MVSNLDLGTWNGGIIGIWIDEVEMVGKSKFTLEGDIGLTC